MRSYGGVLVDDENEKLCFYSNIFAKKGISKYKKKVIFPISLT